MYDSCSRKHALAPFPRNLKVQCHILDHPPAPPKVQTVLKGLPKLDHYIHAAVWVGGRVHTRTGTLHLASYMFYDVSFLCVCHLWGISIDWVVCPWINQRRKRCKAIQRCLRPLDSSNLDPIFISHLFHCPLFTSLVHGGDKFNDKLGKCQIEKTAVHDMIQSSFALGGCHPPWPAGVNAHFPHFCD